MTVVIKFNSAKFHAHIGVYPEERTIGQDIAISAEITLKLTDLAILKADELANTISYGEVYKIIAHEVSLSQDKLLETLGVRIVEALQARFADKFSSLTLSIKKIALPINGIVDNAEVCITI